MGDVMRVKKDYDLTEITRLLLKMRDNCERKEGELYDDPERAEKRDALNAAIDIINNPSYVAAGDLISREAAVQMLREKVQGFVVSMFATSSDCNLARVVAMECANEVRNMEAVDAEPVWLRIDVCDVDKEKGWYRRLLYCPCGQLIKTETWDAKRCFGTWTVLRGNKMPKHCPNCGAKMDKEAEK